VVLFKEVSVEIISEQGGANPPDPLVECPVFGNHSVHGIVGRDKKPGVQMGLEQSKPIRPGRMPINREMEQKSQAHKPQGNNSQTDINSFVRPYLHDVFSEKKE